MLNCWPHTAASFLVQGPNAVSTIRTPPSSCTMMTTHCCCASFIPLPPSVPVSDLGVVRVFRRLLRRVGLCALVASASRCWMEPGFDAVPAMEPLTKPLGVSGEVNVAPREFLPICEQLRRAVPRVGDAFAAFVEPGGDAVLCLKVSLGRLGDGLRRVEAGPIYAAIFAAFRLLFACSFAALPHKAALDHP